MKKDWTIGELLGTSTAYWKGCTLQAAVRLQIFSHLGKQQLTAEDVAHKAGYDTRATELLLNSLSALKLLDKKEERYSNTSFSTAFLDTSSTQYMGHIILHHHHILDGWAQLEEAVRTGNPVTKRSYGEAIERESFLMGMFNLAMSLAPQIAGIINLEGKKHLLDLGGGPGTYAIHFCLTEPALKATIFDKPTTRQFALETVKKFTLSDRVNFVGGDFTIDPITGGPFDIAWLSHILHSNGEDQCLNILKNTIKSMESGGVVFIHDFMLEDSKDKPEFCALFSLNMLINTRRGRSYSDSEIRQMMSNAGLKNIERVFIDSPNGSSILSGVV